MKIAELRGKTADELKTLLLNFKKEALNLRFQKATGELAKVNRIREVRRATARVNTLLTEIAKKESANA